MKNVSRLLRKLRRKVYREAPVATWNRVAEVNWRASYNDLISTFRRGDCGVLSGGAALALWRAATDAKRTADEYVVWLDLLAAPSPLGYFLRPHARLPPSVALGERAVAQQNSP